MRGFGRACKDARQKARRQKRKGGERGFKTRRYGMFGILINWVYECFILFYFVFVYWVGLVNWAGVGVDDRRLVRLVISFFFLFFLVIFIIFIILLGYLYFILSCFNFVFVLFC